MLVEGQAKIFLIMVAIGGLAGLLYDAYRVFRVRSNLRGAAYPAGDLFFWGVTTAVVFLLLLRANQGELRLYVLLGLLGGALLYRSVLSRFAFHVLDFFWHLTGKMVDVLVCLLEHLARVVLFPVHRSVILIVWPLKASYTGSRHLGYVAAGGMKKKAGVVLGSLRVRAADWKHLIERKKKD